MALPAVSDLTAHAAPDLGASERVAPLVEAGRLRPCAGSGRAWASVGRDLRRWPERAWSRRRCLWPWYPARPVTQSSRWRAKVGDRQGRSHPIRSSFSTRSAAAIWAKVCVAPSARGAITMPIGARRRITAQVEGTMRRLRGFSVTSELVD
jgi:hypothetical protein